MDMTRPAGYWKDKITNSFNLLDSRGVKICEPLEFFEPISASDIAKFEKNSGLSLPLDVVDFLTVHMGGFSLLWNADEASPISFGGYENGVLRVDGKGYSLSKRQETLQSLVWYRSRDATDIDVERNDAILNQCIPLTFGTDPLVLRLDTDPCQIVWLDHEHSHQFNDRSVIGSGFYNFLEKWTALHLIEITPNSGVLNEERHEIDLDSVTAVKWLKYVDSLPVTGPHDPFAGLGDEERRQMEALRDNFHEASTRPWWKFWGKSPSITADDLPANPNLSDEEKQTAEARAARFRERYDELK